MLSFLKWVLILAGIFFGLFIYIQDPFWKGFCLIVWFIFFSIFCYVFGTLLLTSSIRGFVKTLK